LDNETPYCPINTAHCILVFSDRMKRIYMIFIYSDYPVDPVKKVAENRFRD